MFRVKVHICCNETLHFRYRYRNIRLPCTAAPSIASDTYHHSYHKRCTGSRPHYPILLCTICTPICLAGCLDFEFPQNPDLLKIFVFIFFDKTYLQKPHCVTIENISSNKKQLQLRFVLKNKYLKSKVKRINLKLSLLYQLK